LYFLNNGIRKGGGIADSLKIKNYSEANYWLRWSLDVFYFLTVILVLLNMINGVIVTAFSAIREDSDKRKYEKNNKCYICSIDRLEFEKKNINFIDHITKDHNISNYIHYIIYLKNKSYYDLDYHEYDIMNRINKRNISLFPVKRAKCLGDNYEYQENVVL